MTILIIGGALGFLFWQLTKKAKRQKLGGQNSTKQKHYLDNFPGRDASSKEILESHLEDDITNCQYKYIGQNSEDDDAHDYRFVNKRKKKAAVVRINPLTKKVLGIDNPLNFGKNQEGKFRESKPEDDLHSHLRNKVTNFWNLEIFNETYNDINEEDLNQ
jgi:hypothetical protein